MISKKELIFGVILGFTSLIVGFSGNGFPSLLNCFFGGYIISYSIRRMSDIEK